MKIGNQPMTGRMTVSRMAFHLSGYPRCGAIEIQYNFHGGIQVNHLQLPQKHSQVSPMSFRDLNIHTLASHIQPVASLVHATYQTTKRGIRSVISPIDFINSSSKSIFDCLSVLGCVCERYCNYSVLHGNDGSYLLLVNR